MKGLLKQSGYDEAADVFDADLVLVNTCSIREKSVHKIYSQLGRLRQIKEDHPHMVVGIAGCVAEQEKENLSKRFPFLDLVFGPDHIRHLPEMVANIEKQRGLSDIQEPATANKIPATSDQRPATILRTGFDRRQDFEFVNLLPNAEEHPVKAFVNIQKGCDNICSFCIVPFVRGREVSRPHGEIIAEINMLVERGVKEVTLLGQNVNSYGLKTPAEPSFARLLGMISEQTKLSRLRFTTSHPKDVGDDLIEQFEKNPILVPQFHLPVQSGSNRILDLMRRQYTRENYLHIVHTLKEKLPEIRFSTDIIVGFPTETEDDFSATMSLLEEVCYDQIYSFVYSSRPYTKAANIQDDIPNAVKQERLQRLQVLDKRINLDQNLKEVGKVHSVLVESRDEENLENPFTGRTATNKVIHFKGEYQIGEIAALKISQANPHCLYGERA